MLIDDPYDASKPIDREKVLAWFRDVIPNRLHPGALIVTPDRGPSGGHCPHFQRGGRCCNCGAEKTR